MTGQATFIYEGRIAESGETFDEGLDEPFTITFGKAHVMPLLEDALKKMEIGEERSVFIPAKEGFGEREDKAIQKVLISDIPNGNNLPVGEYIAWKNPVSLKPIPVKVVSVHNGIAVFDMNHPLAGRDLIYRIKLIDRT